MGDKKDTDDRLSLTRSELGAIIKEAVGAAISLNHASMGVLPADASREERIHAELGTPVPDRTPTKKSLIACFNEDNGAEFSAVVLESRAYPSGRVVDLIDYRYPADIADRAKGMRVRDERTGMADPTVPGKYGLTKQFLQWRWENYDQLDRRAWVGKAANRLPRKRLPGGDFMPPVPVDMGETARTFAA